MLLKLIERDKAFKMQSFVNSILFKQKFILSALIAVGLLLLTSCANTKVVDKNFRTATAFEQGFSGLAIYDVESQKMIFQRNARKYFTPASNIKILTLLTGLVVLEDSVPGIQYTIKGDSLIFSGTGDPSFLNPDLPQSRVFNFLLNSDKQLYLEAPQEEETFFGPGWAWDDYNSYYAAERSSFPIYGNLVRFKKSHRDGEINVVPGFLKDSLIINHEPSNNKIGIERALSGNIFKYSPAFAIHTINTKIPFKYSTAIVREFLQDTLGKEITLLKNASFIKRSSNILYSVPADSLYKRMMVDSDNFVAEQLLLIAAHKLSDTLLSQIAIDHMKERYFNDLPDELHWVDGSGLSRYNLVTPATMVTILSKIYHLLPQERLFNLLATGGKSGTLKNNYIAEEPYLFAKTGTLRHNHSLSGYLKARSGKILIFSFMNSNYTVPTAEIKAQMELILRDFYEKH